MLKIFKKIRLAISNAYTYITTSERFSAIYFGFFTLCFLLFFLDKPHVPEFCGGWQTPAPQDILEKKIAFTSLNFMYASAIFCLLSIGISIFKKLPTAKLVTLGRSLKVLVFIIPLLALFQCSFLFLGKSVLAEKHSSKTSPHNNVWCNPTSCNGVTPALDSIAGKIIDPLSYANTYRLLYGTESAVKLLNFAASNAGTHGNLNLAEKLNREELNLMGNADPKARLLTLSVLARNLVMQGKYKDSLPFYREAQPLVAQLRAVGRTPYDGYYFSVLTEAADAEEKVGNKKEAERIREIVINSRTFCEVDDQGKKQEYKYMPAKTFNDMIAYIQKYKRVGVVPELSRIFPEQAALPSHYMYPLCPEIDCGSDLFTLEKGQYETLLKLANNKFTSHPSS